MNYQNTAIHGETWNHERNILNLIGRAVVPSLGEESHWIIRSSPSEDGKVRLVTACGKQQGEEEVLELNRPSSLGICPDCITAINQS